LRAAFDAKEPRRYDNSDGAIMHAEVRAEGDSDRRYWVKDPAGDTWWLAIQME
jgi:hypothetical protein